MLTTLAPLFQPLTIRRVTLSNRIVMSPKIRNRYSQGVMRVQGTGPNSAVVSSFPPAFGIRRSG